MENLYEVTVTPKIITYPNGGAYTTTFEARTAAEAIKLARQERNENEGTGRYVIGCTYKARRA